MSLFIAYESYDGRYASMHLLVLEFGAYIDSEYLPAE